jgi:mRNA interferase MazF
MTTYKFGDVILVPFPFTDQSTSKKRPAIVISSDNYNQNKPDIILIAVTSQVNANL